MASRVTERTLEEIKARVDIVDLISSYGVSLKRAGSRFKGCCPFHHEKTPSFNVDPTRQAYYCFGCQEHGDAFAFVMKQQNLSFMEAVHTLAEKVGVNIESGADPEAEQRNRLYALHLEMAAFYQRCLEQMPGAATARAYLKTRSLPPEIVKQFGIGFAPTTRNVLQRWAAKHKFSLEELVSAGLLAAPRDGKRQDDYFDRFRGRLMFPICDTQGRVVAFSGRVLDPKSHPAKYINSPETIIFRKSAVLFALDKARTPLVKHPRREAIICEGQIDVIRCHAAGLTTAVASQGTAFSREHADILKRYADTAVLLFDGDTAGRKAAVRTGIVFLEAGFPVRVAALPPGEDPDSLIREQGVEAVQTLIDQAQSVVAFQITAMRAAEERPDAVDAFARISRTVAETIVACSTPMLRAHLQQEAAEILGIPETALAEEVDAMRSRQSESASRAARYQRQSNATATAVADNTDAPAATDSDGAPLYDPFASGAEDDETALDDMPYADETTPADTPVTPKLQVPTVIPPPSPPERSLCELLLQHDGNPEITELLRHYLPDTTLHHPYVRTLYAAWRNADDNDTNTIANFYDTADDQMRTFIDRIIKRCRPLNYHDEITPLEAARDMVSRLWIDMLRTQRSAIGDNPDTVDAQRRLTLTRHIKTLQQAPQEAERRNQSNPQPPVTSWELRERVLRDEIELQVRP